MTEEEKLYTNNTGRKSFQWELWQYCNSLCSFCYLGKENRINNKERQLTSLIDLDKSIDNLDFNEYNNISLIGGEFFQGQLDDPEIHSLFFDIVKKMFKLYQDKKIGSMWITATLTLGDQKHLYEMLDLADSMNVYPNEKYTSSGLWICTSWDSTGRFKNKSMKDNWEHHMINMKNKYPWIKFNTTIILQDSFIDDYINNKWTTKDFTEKYNTTFFFKQCGIPPFGFDDFNIEDKDFENNNDLMLKYKMLAKEAVNKKNVFFPTRFKFLKFLKKFYIDDRIYFDRLFNIMYRADELHRNFLNRDHDIKNERIKSSSGPDEAGRDTLSCGHAEVYAAYIDSNHCCICDKEAIADML